MPLDGHQSGSGLTATDVRRWQAEVSSLRQGVAVTRTLWRMEQDEYRKRRQQFLKMLRRVGKSTEIEPDFTARLAQRIRQVDLQEKQVDETANRVTEMEDALDQAEQSLYSAADQMTWSEVASSPATEKTRSDHTDSEEDTSDARSDPEELDKYLGLIEEVRLLRETYHNIQVDQVVEARRREVGKDSDEPQQETDFAFHERHRQQREPLIRTLIETTRQAEEALQQCLESGISAMSLDELIPPLDVSEIPLLSNAGAPLTLETSASQTNHLELSLIPMKAVNERIYDWTFGMKQNGSQGSTAATEVITPTAELQQSFENAAKFPFEETWGDSDLRILDQRRGLSSVLYKPESLHLGPYKRHAMSMSVSVPTITSSQAMQASIPATPNSF